MKNKALRIAAYLVIAHFVLINGLMFLGKGPLDVMRMVLGLAFFAATVVALFSPRKLGWVFFVVYAWHTLNPQALGLWGVWAAAGVASSAKITTAVVLAAVNLPLLVAAVLIFKPANFASFRSAPPGAPPVGSAGSKP